MPTIRETLDLEDLVITVYAALDDALAEAGLVTRDGKLVPRPGPPPALSACPPTCPPKPAGRR
ncbi:MAG: hypothetical protein NTX40_03700 [Planctomycetota bacterium]|nr:hypothetical protein [Planctomycetota bacterium]